MRLPTISPAFSRSMLDGHSWLGILFGALVYLVCFSGTLIVLVDQLTIWERPTAPVVRSVSIETLGKFAQAVHGEARHIGADHDIYIYAPTDELPHLRAYAAGEKGQRGEWSGDGAGRLAAKIDTPWVAFVQTLHFNLTIPGAAGRYFVGIIGTLLLASLVGGILAHRRILKDAFRLRWGGSRRLTNADLHNRIGVWALPFHLIVSLTGSLLGLSGLIIMVLALVSFKGDQERAIAALLGPQPTEDSRPAPLPDIGPMMARIEASTPGAEIRMLSYQHVGTAGQQVAVTVATPGYLTEGEAWTFDGKGGFKAKAGFTDGNVGMRIYGMITPLHYGTYGGVWLKIIYVLLGSGLTVIVATGGNIWLARRRDQGRAVPRLESLWGALIWSQPLLLTITALWALAGLGGLTAVYWGGLILIFLLAPLVSRRGSSTFLLQTASGGALILLLGAHLTFGQSTDATALAIDAALLVLGVAMLKLASRKR